MAAYNVQYVCSFNYPQKVARYDVKSESIENGYQSKDYSFRDLSLRWYFHVATGPLLNSLEGKKHFLSYNTCTRKCEGMCDQVQGI